MPLTGRIRLGSPIKPGLGAWTGAAAGVIAPAIGFFAGLGPPLASQASLLVPPFAAVIGYLVHGATRPVGEAERREARRRALLLLALGIACLLGYLTLMSLWTVTDPLSGTRSQTGFGTAAWSLSLRGRSLIAEHPTEALAGSMLRGAAIRAGGPEVIWKSWTIVAAGSILMGLYAAGFTLWVMALAVVTRLRGTAAF